MDDTQARNLKEIFENREVLRNFENANILLLSPNLQDYKFWKRLFPKAKFTIATFKNWDLNIPFNNSALVKLLGVDRKSKTSAIFDLAIAQNVFMMLPNPQIPAQNIADICDNLFFQDLVYRKRSISPDGYGNDFDKSRFATKLSNNKISGTHQISTVFKIGEILFQKEYNGAPNEFHSKNDLPIHILALIKFKSSVQTVKYSRMYSTYSVFFLFFATYTNRIVGLLFRNAKFQISGTG